MLLLKQQKKVLLIVLFQAHEYPRFTSINILFFEHAEGKFGK
jgi:hypothetical protein